MSPLTDGRLLVPPTFSLSGYVWFIWLVSFNPKNRTTEAEYYGVFAHRNPVPKPRNDGKWVSRSAERRPSGPLPQEPPRITL